MHAITTLLDRSSPVERLSLPARLKAAYGGDLQFPNPGARGVYVFANFVTTLDGVVSYQMAGKSGGGEISGFNEEDRFIMGLLRSLADAVLVGSGTLHGDPGQIRLPEAISPAYRHEFRSFREAVLGKPTQPLNVVISGSGKVDLAEPTFHTPGLTGVIITTAPGYERLRREHGRSLAAAEVRATDDQGPKVSPLSALRILHDEFGVEHLLHEGGPTIFGQFLTERLVDEIFLTLSPQIAGRSEAHWRPGMIEQSVYGPDDSPWFDLVSLKIAQSHLFLRYRSRHTVGNGMEKQPRGRASARRA